MFLVYVVFCFIVFGCQYQCNQLRGKTRLRNYLLRVEWDVKPYTLTQYMANSQYVSEIHCYNNKDIAINQSINQQTILTCAQKQTSSQLSLPHGTIN